MRFDGLDDRRDFGSWETQVCQNFWHGIRRIRYVIPGRQFVWLLRPVTDKYAEIVEPRGCMEDVIIEWFSLGELDGELIKSQLVGEFVDGLCVGANKLFDRGSVALLRHLY